MIDADRDFGNPDNSVGDYYVVPGEDLLDKDLMSDLLTRSALTPSSSTVTIYDTTYFAYDGYIFNRYAKYICDIKSISSIDLDDEIFVNKPLFRIHELTTIWKQNDPARTQPWEIDNLYFAFTDSGYHVASLLVYWSELMPGWTHKKFILNDRIFSNKKAMSNFILSVNPIPAKNNLNISFINLPKGTGSLKLVILNTDGRKEQFYDLSIKYLEERTNTTLDISSLKAGVYILAAISSAGTTQCKFTVIP